MSFMSRLGIPGAIFGPFSPSSSSRAISPLIKIHSAVSAALKNNKPIVALESTIITHGLPYPDNVHTALAIEQTVRDQGAVPATTAFIDGKAHIGLTPTQLERLGEIGRKATKTSIRDISSVLAAGKGSIGATTVAATVNLAAKVGIPIFATGGIGGVHRGGENSMDISADLVELSRNRVSVFCSGPKSVLDIPRTLEYLETLGVNVCTFNPSGQMPAFYTSQSGCKVPIVSSPKGAADIIHANKTFGGLPGTLFGVPIPGEYEEDGLKLQAMVNRAIQESIELGIDKRGKEVTPWLLQRINELSSGLSLVSNKALVINNAAMAAKVAEELVKIDQTQEASEREEMQSNSVYSMMRGQSGNGKRKKNASELFLVGAATVDITSQPETSAQVGSILNAASTYPGRNRLTVGGVARNMAESAHHVLHDLVEGEDISPIVLVSALGDDTLGALVSSRVVLSGMRNDGISVVQGERTPSVVLHLDEKGELLHGVADMDDLPLYPKMIRQELPSESEPSAIVAFDANISVFTMKALFEDRRHVTIFEPTSIVKCIKILDAGASPDVITPNEAELLAMYSHAKILGMIPSVDEISPFFESAAYSNNISLEVFHAAQRLCRLLNSILVVKRGANGVLLAKPNKGAVNMQHFSAPLITQEEIVNTTGCGDSFAGTIAACALLRLREEAERKDGLFRPRDWSNPTWKKVINTAQQAAILTLKSTDSSSSELKSLGSRAQQAVEVEFRSRLKL